ncbi:MAG: hypothetical protein J6V32_01750 [Elusimicrobiaceae bacterium]|nr:hypothetical protein [Elusimicrobiaceae bacterium]
MEQNQITEQEIVRVLEVVKKIGYINWAVCNKELSSPHKATVILRVLQKRGVIQEDENGEWAVNTSHTILGTSSMGVTADVDEMNLNKEKIKRGNNNQQPEWITICTWIVGLVLCCVYGVVFFSDFSDKSINVFQRLMFTLGCSVIGAGAVNLILSIFYYSVVGIAKSTAALTNKGSQILSNMSIAITKRIAKAVVNVKKDIMLEEEKNLRKRVNDLELQLLKQRIQALENTLTQQKK